MFEEWMNKIPISGKISTKCKYRDNVYCNNCNNCEYYKKQKNKQDKEAN